MASISIQLLNSGLGNEAPDACTAGTNAPATANAIEVRVDLAGGWNAEKLKTALEVIYNRFVDGRFTQNGSLVTPSN